MMLRLVLAGQRFHLRRSRSLPCRSGRRTTTLNHLPDMLSGMPWVRWPPSARLMPMMVSPGLAKAISTAWLACEPEFGCTLAASAPNSCLEAVDGELLGHVDVLAATVVALARVAFGVLVGQLGALGFHHRVADVVLGGDQFDVLFLTLVFGFDGLPEFRVNFCQGVFRGKHGVSLKPLKKGRL